MTTLAPPPSETRATTVVGVSRASTPGAPLRVDATDGPLAVRTISRTSDRAEIALVATGALLLGGDHVVVQMHVADGCHLEVTDIGGTVAYDGEGSACRWDVDLRLGDGARLDWYGMPFVVSAGADVVRTTTARLGVDARLVLRETIVLGRAGERGGRILVRSDTTDATGPLLVEEISADGAAPVPGVLGPHRVVDTLTVLHTPDADGPPVPPEASAPLALPVDGATTLHLDSGATVTRWLGGAVHLSPLQRALDRCR